MGKQLDIFEGMLLRDEGIQQAIDHADQVDEKWSETAYRFLLSFISTTTTEFMVEDIRIAAEKSGVPIPPSDRAWGGIIVRAAKAGLIRRVGYRAVANPKAHCTPATLWTRS